MKKIYLNIIILNFLFTVISFFFLPDRVATHFGAGGIPNAFSSKMNYVLFFFLLEVPMAVFYYYLPELIVSMPKKFVSMPNKDHWLSEQNKQMTKGLISPLIYECGSVLFVFLLFCGILSLVANLSDPVRLNENAIWIGLITFTVYITFWCVKFIKFFTKNQNNQYMS